MGVTTSAAIPSAELARVIANALAFCPAVSQVPVIRLRLAHGLFEAMGTDTYTAGRDYAPTDSQTGPDVWCEVPRDVAVDMEKTGRADKKNTGRLTISVDGVCFEPVEGEPIMSPVTNDDLQMWDSIGGMLEPEQDFRVAFTPGYLTRFGKVKADKTERVMDVSIDDPDSPVLVKIGPSFRGLIMPVNRSAHAELIGSEGLW